MLIALNIKSHEYLPATGRQVFKCPFQVDPVNGSCQHIVSTAQVAFRHLVFLRVKQRLQRNSEQSFLAKAHQRHIHRHTVQPRREGRLATESSDLAEHQKEHFLR